MKKKGYRTFFVSLILAVMFAAAVPACVFAANSPSISIPVTLTIKGVVPEQQEAYRVLLKADDQAFPMPEGSVDGEYTLTVTSGKTAKFPDITYSQLGVYTYTVSQVAGDNELCTYDDRVYTLKVYITNVKAGSGLEATAILSPDEGENKFPEAEFVNSYEAPPAGSETPPASPDAPKSGDDTEMGLYACLAAGSMIVLAAVLLIRRRAPKEDR